MMASLATRLVGGVAWRAAAVPINWESFSWCLCKKSWTIWGQEARTYHSLQANAVCRKGPKGPYNDSGAPFFTALSLASMFGMGLKPSSKESTFIYTKKPYDLRTIP